MNLRNHSIALWRSLLLSSLALVLVLCAGCMPIQPAAVPKPITLHLAIPDGQGLPRIDNYVQEFITQTHTLSQGAITIEPVYHAGDGTFAGYEKGVLQRMLLGKFDLALVPSRTWDSESITNFQALQAPFLIDNDALAEAVATSAVGAQMLDSLSAVGLVGLTLWPEDLRHPFSVVPDKPFLSPKDAAGKQMRAGPSDVTYQMIDALGATPMFEDSGYEIAESGLQQGGTLTGKPSATGNVTFYPKYQILFATGAAFARLTEQQRTVLRQAAAATQKKALANRPKEVDAATAYCADGGTIVLASDEQVKAFAQAVKPVFDNLTQDPLNAQFIQAIRDLKAKVTPAPGAEACAPKAAQQSSAPTAPLAQKPTTDATMARLRLANWVFGSSATDMYVDGQIAFLGKSQRVLTQVPVGFLTGFLYLDPGMHRVAVVPSGKSLDEAMIALDVNLAVGHRYTVGVMGQKEDAHFSPLVIDETAALAQAGNPSTQNMMIYVNNIAGFDTVDFLEDGVGPSKVPYGGFVTAPIKSGHVDHLVVTINGSKKFEDNPGNFDELPSGSFIHANGGHFPTGTTAVYDGESWSDLNAVEMLKQFSAVKVVWDNGDQLSFNTFLAALEKAGLSDMLTKGTMLID